MRTPYLMFSAVSVKTLTLLSFPDPPQFRNLKTVLPGRSRLSVLRSGLAECDVYMTRRSHCVQYISHDLMLFLSPDSTDVTVKL